MCGIVFGHTAVVDGDLNEGTMDVLGHVLFVTANVEVSASLEPLPYFGAMFFEAVLNVDFFFLVS